MNSNFSRIATLALVLIIGIAISIYIWTKATVSSFTHDESYTYLNYVHQSFMDIISYKCLYTNNHILNSLFMKYSEKVFGVSEIALRLPNLLLLSVYMVYSYFLFRNTNQFLAVCIFVLLCSNTSILDYFGLARGYGMSCGFMVMSLYHFIESYYTQKTKNVILFHLGALLAILSSFTLLNFYGPLLLIHSIMSFIESKFSNKKYSFLNSNKVHVIPLVLIILVLYEPVRRVIKFNHFDFGGKKGFYQDTVTSIINSVFHNVHLSPFTLIAAQVVFTGIILLSLAVIVRMLLIRNESFFNQHKGLIISNLLLICISIAIVLQHHILGTDYPISRFSTFLFPLYIIHLGFLLSYFISIGYQKIIHPIALSMALLSSTGFVLKTDLHSCAEWGFDMETKNMIQKLITIEERNEPKSGKIKLGVNWLFEPTINFYRQAMKINWLLPATRNGITKNDDYYYVFKDEIISLNPSDYEVVAEFKRTNTLLLKVKNR